MTYATTLVKHYKNEFEYYYNYYNKNILIFYLKKNILYKKATSHMIG